VDQRWWPRMSNQCCSVCTLSSLVKKAADNERTLRQQVQALKGRLERAEQEKRWVGHGPMSSSHGL
jgi:hypothetical protein